VTDFYFAYGSNMSGARLCERIERPERICVARLAGWRLVYNKPGRDGSGKANLVPDAGAHVHGVVWSIAQHDWPILDRFEPGYARTRLAVEAEDDRVHETLAYLHPTRGPELVPHAWYVQYLIDGAREHGLPDAYLRALKSVPTR